MPTIGSLFSGIGGLDLGVENVLGGHVIWHCEADPAPAKVLAAHWPNIPNLGDITNVDWTQTPPVDILIGGSPCQDLSRAGTHTGLTPGTRSGLWTAMAQAIGILQPRLVIWENVHGALSAPATSNLELCPGCMGNPRNPQPALRAFGRVLADLANLGFDARWTSLRIADLGGCHHRARLFLAAWPQTTPTTHTASLSRQRRRRTSPTQPRPNPGNPPSRPVSGLLGLLPTPTATSYGRQQSLSPGAKLRPSLEYFHDFQAYQPAITRHEHLAGYPAPAPIQIMPGRKHAQLCPEFVEWMMCFPQGWITNPTLGLTRRQQLKALGNAASPPQTEAALYQLLQP